MNLLVPPALDHLVIAAASLDEGVAWCEATLGVTPTTGGRHPLMATHNRLLALGGSRHPDSYLEIIAIDPHAQPQRQPGQRRWFDLDDEALQATLSRRGPRLIHAVARVPELATSLRALSALPEALDGGTARQAARDTPHGLLQWQIGVRDDGRRLFDGTLPTLIQWGALHPAAHLPASPLQLLSVQATHPRHDALRQALNAIGLKDVLPVEAGPADLRATLQTQRGLVTLHSGDD